MFGAAQNSQDGDKLNTANEADLILSTTEVVAIRHCLPRRNWVFHLGVPAQGDKLDMYGLRLMCASSGNSKEQLGYSARQ